MAVLVIGQLQGGDAALDARMMQELGLQNAPAPGALARFAGPTDELHTAGDQSADPYALSRAVS